MRCRVGGGGRGQGDYNYFVDMQYGDDWPAQAALVFI